MNRPYQRKGADSHTQVGRDFEAEAQAFFAKKGLYLMPGIEVKIGINGLKPHKFDLGDRERKVLVECKSHKWTEGDNVPVAKITTWIEAMYFFYSIALEKLSRPRRFFTAEFAEIAEKPLKTLRTRRSLR